MKSMASILVVALIALGGYSFYLKQAVPGVDTSKGHIITQAISTTGVEMDLNAIAQADRQYFAENGAYASLGELSSSGTMNIAGGGRDGYTYSGDASASSHVVTARHPDIPAVVKH